MTSPSPSVFISYAHGSREHNARVFRLAQRLHGDGLTVHIDQGIDSPPQGWPAWMLEHLRDDDFVLVVCTPTYRDRAERRVPPVEGRGVTWEGAILTLQLYEAHLLNDRAIPLLFSDETADSIPVVLQGVSRYVVDDDDQYELLYTRLIGVRPHLGTPGPLRPPRLSALPAPYADLILPEWDLSSKGLAGRDNVRTNLPDATTRFIGRSEDVERTRANVRRHPVVTLTAPAGTGKTRLALAVAESLVDDFRDGVWWVDLAALSDAQEIPHQLAQTLGIFQQPEQVAVRSVVHAIRRSEMLLVFDNCERHTIDVAQLIDQIARTCSWVHVLATSRETLGSEDEVAQAVRPLTAPRTSGASPESVRNSDGGALFLSRARMADDQLSLDSPADASLVAEICEATQGVPLAIELAAGAVPAVGLDAVATGIRQTIAVLGAAQRDRVLDATIDWCYQQLEEADRAHWQALSAFEGSFDLDAAAAVVSADADAPPLTDEVLQRLSRRGFISPALRLQEHESAGLAPRYRLLESLRHFARQRAVEAGALTAHRRRHAEYHTTLAETTRPLLRQHEQRRWLLALDADHDDLRLALGWCWRNGETEMALRLSGALGRFWHMRGYWHEGRRLLRQILAMDDVASHPVAHAQALVAKGHLAFVGGDFRSARTFYERALDIRSALEDRGAIADALHRVGLVVEVQGDLVRAQALQERALGIARELGNVELEADVLHHLGVLAGMAANPSVAEQHLVASLELRRAQGDGWGEAWSIVVLGNHYAAVGEIDRAAECYRESLALYEEQGDRRRIASALINVAGAEIRSRAFIKAEKQLARATRMVHDLGDLRGVAEALETWAVLAATVGDAQRCFTLLGAAEALREEIEAKRTPMAMAWIDSATAALDVRHLDKNDWMSAGHRLGPDEAVAQAIGSR